jgi:hypothetical protein
VRPHHRMAVGAGIVCVSALFIAISDAALLWPFVLVMCIAAGVMRTCRT